MSRGPDPNEGSTDPVIADYWQLGESVQDQIGAAGYQSDTVEGLAVDIHDLLQAAERIREELAPAVLAASDRAEMVAAVKALRAEFNHVRWHGEAATEFLGKALAALDPANEQPL